MTTDTNQRPFIIAVLLLLVAPLLYTMPAFAPTCIELNNCVFTDPFTSATFSFQVLIGDWIFPLVWGSIVGTIYVVSKNPMLAGISGLMISTVFISGSTFQYSSLSQAWYFGYILLAVSGGVMLFYMIWSKARNP